MGRFALAPFFTRGPNFVRFVRERLLRRLMLIKQSTHSYDMSVQKRGKNMIRVVLPEFVVRASIIFKNISVMAKWTFLLS